MMDEKQDAQDMDGKLYRVFRCFGKDFPVYYRYCDKDGQAIPEYPDFTAEPQYTDIGRPYVLSPQEGCSLWTADSTDDALDVGCGDCKFFCQESGFSVFGICMNECRRLQTNEMEND